MKDKSLPYVIQVAILELRQTGRVSNQTKRDIEEYLERNPDEQKRLESVIYD